MCPPKVPKPSQLPEAPAAPEAPPESPVTATTDELTSKRRGKSALRIDLAAGGNTSLSGVTGLNIL